MPGGAGVSCRNIWTLVSTSCFRPSLGVSAESAAMLFGCVDYPSVLPRQILPTFSKDWRWDLMGWLSASTFKVFQIYCTMFTVQCITSGPVKVGGFELLALKLFRFFAGRSTGQAYVQFATAEQANKALERNR